MTTSLLLTPELRQRLEGVVGRPLLAVRAVEGGYTPALRLVLSLAGGASVFIKIATDADTATALRREHHVYASLSGPFLPAFLGWDDDGEQPLLVLEDLSAGFWPPPWNEARLRGVVAALEELWQRELEEVPCLETFGALARGWERIAADPEPFLSLGVADESWLQAALPALLAIDGEAVLRGESLLHMDVRSDNLCFVDERTVLVDWNWVCAGNPAVDLGAWLPSLELQGGPAPEALLPDAGDVAALLSGFWATQAPLPPLAHAPHLREMQRKVLAESALPWAIRALGLPPLHGS